VIDDIRKTNVSFISTSLVSMIPLCNKVSSSARGLTLSVQYISLLFDIDLAAAKVIWTQ
jgi:hypothetical protein